MFNNSKSYNLNFIWVSIQLIDNFLAFYTFVQQLHGSLAMFYLRPKLLCHFPCCYWSLLAICILSNIELRRILCGIARFVSNSLLTVPSMHSLLFLHMKYNLIKSLAISFLVIKLSSAESFWWSTVSSFFPRSSSKLVSGRYWLGL